MLLEGLCTLLMEWIVLFFISLLLSVDSNGSIYIDLSCFNLNHPFYMSNRFKWVSPHKPIMFELKPSILHV